MVVLGAGGHAKEVVDILWQGGVRSVCLLDDTRQTNTLLWGEFDVYCDYNQLPADINTFVLGVGNIKVRKLLSEKALSHGLAWCGVRAKSIELGAFDSRVAPTADLMQGVIISSSVSIGKGSLINRATIIHHDVQIGEYCEIAPHVSILGGVTIGQEVFIGAGAQVFPKIVIGNGAVIGGGAVVNKNIPANCVAVGNPVRIIKQPKGQ